PANESFQYLPTLTSTGALNNYMAPATPAFLGTDAYSITEKIDEYIGSKDHVSEMFYYKYLPRTTFTSLPATISDSQTSFKRTSVLRSNWDHTFSPRLVNHVAFGFQDDKFYGGGIDGGFADKIPQLPAGASGFSLGKLLYLNQHRRPHQELQSVCWRHLARNA